MRVPCIDCPEQGCGVKHDSCLEYQKYIEYKKTVNENKRKRNRYDSYMVDAIARMKRSVSNSKK